MGEAIDPGRRHWEEAAYLDWEAGKVIPHRITAALNLRQLYGPEVDAASPNHRSTGGSKASCTRRGSS
jgi:hypothetical protein